jgi:hypothetical protein
MGYLLEHEWDLLFHTMGIIPQLPMEDNLFRKNEILDVYESGKVWYDYSS